MCLCGSSSPASQTDKVIQETPILLATSRGSSSDSLRYRLRPIRMSWAFMLFSSVFLFGKESALLDQRIQASPVCASCLFIAVTKVLKFVVNAKRPDLAAKGSVKNGAKLREV